MKSVPPLVPPKSKQNDIKAPLIIPPKTLYKSISSVQTLKAGIKSTKKPEVTITMHESKVNFLPINLNPIYIGNKFNKTLINVYDGSNSKNLTHICCINSVTPDKPPGNNPAGLTNILILIANKNETNKINKALIQKLFFFFILSYPLLHYSKKSNIIVAFFYLLAKSL